MKMSLINILYISFIRIWRVVCWYYFHFISVFILGPPLFNIYICNLFFEISQTDIAKKTHDNIPYVCLWNLHSVISTLPKYTKKLIKWFHINNLISNVGKSNLIVNFKKLWEVNISCVPIEYEESVKLFAIYINNNLNFSYHVSRLCKEASKKLYALGRIAKYININKQRTREIFCIWTVSLQSCDMSTLETWNI